MSLTDITIDFDLAQILGADFDARRTKAYVTTNVESGTLMDTTTGETRLGDEAVTINSDGTGAFTTWATGADGNPISWQTSLVIDYPRTGQRDRKRRVFGPWTLTTADDGKNITALEDEQAVPPEYLTTVTTALQAYVDSGQAAATTASAAATTASGAADTAVNASNLAEQIALGDADAAFGVAQLNPASPLSVAQGDVLDDPTHPLTAGLANTFGTVLRPSQDGAVGDKTTDDTLALQATIDRLKAHVVTDPPLSRPVVIDGEGGTYKVTGSLDWTGLTLGRGWVVKNLHIIAAGAGTVALDLTASRFGRFSNVHVWGDQTNQPHTGILLSAGTTQAADPCSGFVFDNVSVDGYFTSSGLHLNAAEENEFLGCRFWNRRTADGSGDAYAAILDGAGYKTLPAGPLGRNAARSSFTVNKFDRCAIQKPFGVAGPALFLQDLASISWESCYLTAGAGSAIEWRLTSFTPYRVYMDFQLETTGVDRFIEFTSDAAGAREVRGLHCTFGNMYADQEVFSASHANITTLALRSFKSHLYRMASGVALANHLFAGEAKVTISGGDIVVPTAADFDTGFASLSDVKVLGMDGTTATYETGWASYTPTLTNWTLGDGTLTGEYRKVGRTVHYKIRYTVGSTDTPSGNFSASLPVATDGGASGMPRGTAHLFDASAAARCNRFVNHLTTTTVGIYDADHVAVAALTPWTWAAGDVIDIAGTYEAAN